MAKWRLVGSAWVDVDFTGTRLVNGVWVVGQAASGTTGEAAGQVTLPAITASGAALVTYSTAGNPTLPQITVSGNADVVYDASGAVTLPQVTIDGTAAASITGQATGQVTLPAITASGAALITFDASGAVNLPSLTTGGAAALEYKAAGQATLPQVTVSGTAAAATGLGGTYNAAAYFATGSTVTIALYDPVTGATISLDDNTCKEIGSTGMFVWDVANLTTQPTGYQEYVYRMSDGTNYEGGIINMFDQTAANQIAELYKRFDLDSTDQNTYNDDGSVISNSTFTLTKTTNGDGTFDVVKS